MVADVFYNVEISTDNSAGDDWLASISEIKIQDLSVSRYITDRARGIRSRPLIASEHEEFYILVFPIWGKMYFYQYAREGLVQPGRYVMLKSSDYYQLCCDDVFDGVFVKASSQCIDRSYEMASSHCSNWRPANTVLSRVLLSGISAISDLTAFERASFSRGLYRQVLSMITLMLQTEQGDECETTSARHGLYRRLRQLIEIRFQDEQFSPSSAATELRVSLGYLHRCTKAHGTTFSQILKDVRLARAYEMLQETASRRQIGEVAFLNGFSDHSIFSKLFKQRYGKTPKELQSSHLLTE